MGCAASTQGKSANGENDQKYTDDSDGEGELSDDQMSDASETSEASTSSQKSMTRVTNTRGRVASSSTTTPKLHHHQTPVTVYEPGMGDVPGNIENRKAIAPTRAAPENFLFGDFNVDPRDVARQRVERLNRVRRPSRHFNDMASLNANNNSGDHTMDSKVKPMGEIFMLNDFVINAMDEDDLPAMSAASIPIPNGFRRLASLSVQTLIGHTDRVKALVLGREERSFLSAAITDSVVSMSDMRGQELNCYPGHDAYIVALALSRDGKFFASSARDGTIAVWEYSTNREHAMKKQVRTFAADEAQNAISISLAFASNNRHLIAGGQDGCCRVWEIDRAGMPLVYEGHSNVIVSVSSHPTEALVASASGDKSVHIWRYETGELLMKLTGHDGAVISVSFTLDGKRILSNDDRSCRLWDAETGQLDLNVKLETIVGPPSTSKTKHHTANREECDYIKKTALRYPKFSERLEQALTGQNTTAARAAQMERVTARTIFTVSALLPGLLCNSYFAVACTTGDVYIINAVTGLAEATMRTKAPIFAMHSGSYEKLLCGDIFGNVYAATFRS